MIKKYNQIAHDCQKQLINYCCSEASVPGVSGVAGPRNGVPGRVAHRARCCASQTLHSPATGCQLLGQGNAGKKGTQRMPQDALS